MPTLNGEHGVEYHVPYPASHPKPKFEILIVVSKVIFFHRPHVCWKLRVVQGIVHAVIQNVECKGTRYNAVCHRRREDSMSQLCQRRLQYREQERRHDKPQAIHRHEMMNTMEQEMQHEEDRPIWEHFVDMEQETMHAIFQNGPDYVSREEAQNGLDECIR